MLSGISIILAFASAVAQVTADQVYDSTQTQAYANGAYGEVPSQTYRSRPDLTAPAVNIAVSKDGQADGYIFTNWEGSNCPRNMPYIMDNQGHMVWMPEDAYLTHVCNPITFRN